MSLWDDIGETLTGISDTASSIYKDWTDIGESNTAAAASAAPELNRESDTTAAAQQPTGQPINTTLPKYGMNQQTLLIFGVFFLALMGAVIAFKK